MPEGDTIHFAANRIRPVLEGRIPDALETPHPRFGRDRWPDRLAGRAVRSRGRARQAPLPALRGRADDPLPPADDGLLARTWTVEAQCRARRARAWLVIRRDDREVLQFNGPVLELMTGLAHAAGPQDRGARAGHPRADAGRGSRACGACARTIPRARSATRCSTSARSPGSGTCGRSRAACGGIDPWRPAGEVADEEALAILAETRPRMQQSASDGIQDRFKVIYGKAGRPCPRCGGIIQQRQQGLGNRLTYWCPGASDERAAAHRPQGRRPDRARQHARLLRRRARATAST